MRLALLAIVMTLFGAQGAVAQVRTWVASNGLDSNPCTRIAPCRNFAAAINAVAAGGEVVALDSAGYGAFTIDKDVQVIAPEGVHAAIAPTDPAASVLIVSPAQRVVLKNLVFVSHGSMYGIYNDYSFARAHISDCTLLNYSYGIFNENGGYLHITDSLIRGSETGAYFVGDPFPARFWIERTRFEEIGGTALQAEKRAEGTIAHSSLHGVGSGYGINAIGTIDYQPAVVVEGCIIADFSLALLTTASNATIAIAGSTLSFNQFVWQGRIFTRENNTVILNDNLTPLVFTFAPQ